MIRFLGAEAKRSPVVATLMPCAVPIKALGQKWQRLTGKLSLINTSCKAIKKHPVLPLTDSIIFLFLLP